MEKYINRPKHVQFTQTIERKTHNLTWFIVDKLRPKLTFIPVNRSCLAFQGRKVSTRRALLDGRRNTASENPTLENQESDCMADDDGEEDAGIKGHEGEHEEVGQTDTDKVHQRLSKPSRNMVCTSLDKTAIGEPFQSYGNGENDEEAENVHAKAIARPVREEDVGPSPPKEGHVHHLLVVHVHASHVSMVHTLHFTLHIMQSS